MFCILCEPEYDCGRGVYVDPHYLSDWPWALGQDMISYLWNKVWQGHHNRINSQGILSDGWVSVGVFNPITPNTIEWEEYGVFGRI